MFLRSKHPGPRHFRRNPTAWRALSAPATPKPWIEKKVPGGYENPSKTGFIAETNQIWRMLGIQPWKSMIDAWIGESNPSSA